MTNQPWPRWAPVRLFFILFFLAVVPVLPAADRLNHFHSDDNQQTIRRAREKFEEAVSDNVGLGPVLLRNLDAQIGLLESVGRTRLEIIDQDLATALTGGTWNRLREDFFRRVGAMPRRAPGVTRDAALAVAQTNLDVQIVVRMAQVRAVATVLQALAEAELALAQQTRAQVDAAVKTLSNAVPHSVPTLSSNLDGLLRDFRRAAVSAGRRAVEEPAARAALSSLQQTIAKLAESSRDPASVYALVAMTGAGMDPASGLVLSNYLAFLRQELARVRTNSASSVAARAVTDARWLPLEKSIHRSIDAVTFQTAPFAPSATELKFEERVADIMKQADKVLLELTNVAEQLPKIGKEIDETLEDANLRIRWLENLLEDPSAISNALIRLGPLSTDAKLTFVLTNSLPAEVVQNLNTPEFRQAVRQASQVLKDWEAENRAAGARLLQFFTDLARVELNLHQENARHQQALSSICARELKRWQAIHSLNVKMRDYYTIETNIWSPPTAPGPPTQPTIRLFAERASLEAWTNYYAWTLLDTNRPHHRKGYGVPAVDDIPRGPVVLPDDPVLASVRLLAEQARAFQTAAPSQKDPLGYYTRWSNQRVWSAAQLISGYTLMISLNEHYAEENGRLLAREVKEHDLHIDGLLARANEADLRLGLGSQEAFHGSGVTQADLEAFFGLVQSALLSWIGVKL